MSEEILINGKKITELSDMFFEYCELKKETERLQEENNILKQAIKNKNFVAIVEENEELKKRQITKNGFICDCEQNVKYKQALEEIKQIVFDEIDKTDADDELMQIYGTIYNKCSEALNDRN